MGWGWPREALNFSPRFYSKQTQFVVFLKETKTNWSYDHTSNISFIVFSNFAITTLSLCFLILLDGSCNLARIILSLCFSHFLEIWESVSYNISKPGFKEQTELNLINYKLENPNWILMKKEKWMWFVHVTVEKSYMTNNVYCWDFHITQCFLLIKHNTLDCHSLLN